MVPKELRWQILKFADQHEGTSATKLAQNIGVSESEIKKQLDILAHDKLITFLMSTAPTLEARKYVDITLTPSGSKTLEGEELTDSPVIYGYQIDRLEQQKIPITIDVFLSYASADQQEANLLFDAIINAGGKVFLAAKSLRPGDDFAEEIRKALWASHQLWLLVSPNSLRSDW